jgi:uncharacterized protein YndB with AHSA1/START domain
MIDKQFQIRPNGDREIVMTRGFDAPKQLLWEAYTRPELLKRWLGVFGGWELAVCEIDLRVGGAYRWEWRNGSGQRMACGGVYKELDAPDRLVCTEQFDEPWYEGGSLNTVTFVEAAGRTTMTTTMRYTSTAVRDGVLKSPMEGGVAKSYDALEALVQTTR